MYSDIAKTEAREIKCRDLSGDNAATKVREMNDKPNAFGAVETAIMLLRQK